MFKKIFGIGLLAAVATAGMASLGFLAATAMWAFAHNLFEVALVGIVVPISIITLLLVPIEIFIMHRLHIC